MVRFALAINKSNYQYSGYFGVPKNIIWRRGLLDPMWVKLRQLFHPRDRLVDAPALISVRHLNTKQLA